MNILPKNPDYGNQNIADCTTYPPRLYALSDNKSIAGSPQISDNSGNSDQQRVSVRSFNKKLALDIQKKLNAKKPDITGAFVLRTLDTWKKSRRFRNMGNRVPGAAYKSLEGICEDLPWLDRSSVLGAIKRLEKAFPKDFIVDRSATRVLNIEISDRLSNSYFSRNRTTKKEGAVELSLDSADALKYGVLEGVLIRNLAFKTHRDKVSNPVRDGQGRIYGEMSSTKLTKTKGEDGSLQQPNLPFGRQCVSDAIQTLKKCGVFVEHTERKGFYRFERGQSSDLETQESAQNRLSSNATALSSNSTVVSSNSTKLSPDATVYSGQIERDRNEDRKEIESDKDATESLPAARSVESSRFNKSELEISGDFCSGPDEIREFLIPVEESTLQSIEIIPELLNSSAPVNLPLFIRDEFPELIAKTVREVAQLKKALNTPVEPVHPDLLPFDLIQDPEMLSWRENGLFLNPLTDRPVDWANFEEQIDLAVDELGIESFFSVSYSRKDMLEFREHFKRHEGLSIPMVKKMLERITDCSDLPSFRPQKKEKVDHYYFARRINDLKTLNRYFLQLLRETFAPFIDENGDARFEDGVRLRWWPQGEVFYRENYYYPLSASFENMPEPFRSILEKDIEEERERLLDIEASQESIQDAQDNGEIENPPSDQDLLTGDEMDAFLRAEYERSVESYRQK
jgi:hypothetical protein